MRYLLGLMIWGFSLNGAKTLIGNQVVLELCENSILKKLDRLLRMEVAQIEEQKKDSKLAAAIACVELIRQKLDTGVRLGDYVYSCDYKRHTLSIIFPYKTAAKAIESQFLDEELKPYILGCKIECVE